MTVQKQTNETYCPCSVSDLWERLTVAQQTEVINLSLLGFVLQDVIDKGYGTLAILHAGQDTAVVSEKGRINFTRR